MSQESRDSSPKLNNGDLNVPGSLPGSKEKEEYLSKRASNRESDGLWNEFIKDIDREKSKVTSVARRSTGGLGSLTSVIKKEKKEAPPKKFSDSPLHPPRKVSHDLFDLSTEFVPSKEKKQKLPVTPKTEELESKFIPIKSEDLSDSKADNSKTDAGCSASTAVKRPSGLGSMMDALSSKKTKVGCLDKSKVDWDAFVQKEGLKEELATFNRGKNGFVEKQMFLERADLRRFELEKGAREKTRKPHI